eukprot:SAG11_NODE_6237_length_1355_cov_2.750796_1_plen_194_part_00
MEPPREILEEIPSPWLDGVGQRYLMSIRHSLMRFATKHFVPRRYFFVRYRVSTSRNEIYRNFVPWSKSFGSGKLLGAGPVPGTSAGGSAAALVATGAGPVPASGAGGSAAAPVATDAGPVSGGWPGRARAGGRTALGRTVRAPTPSSLGGKFAAEPSGMQLTLAVPLFRAQSNAGGVRWARGMPRCVRTLLIC